jgi:hypothetical protein
MSRSVSTVADLTSWRSGCISSGFGYDKTLRGDLWGGPCVAVSVVYRSALGGTVSCHLAPCTATSIWGPTLRPLSGTVIPKLPCSFSHLTSPKWASVPSLIGGALQSWGHIMDAPDPAPWAAGPVRLVGQPCPYCILGSPPALGGPDHHPNRLLPFRAHLQHLPLAVLLRRS